MTPLPDVIAAAVVVALSDLRKDAERTNTILPRRVAIAKVTEILGAYRITKKHEKKPGDKRKSTMTEEEWLKFLEASPAYQGIDVRREFEKCKAWATTTGVRELSRRRFVNWLNKADRTIGTARRAATNGDTYKEPEGWRDVLRRIGRTWDREKLDEYCRGEWDELPITIRQEILKAL